MWNLLQESMANGLIVTCTILAFVIPYAIDKLNTMLHNYGDPPWKKEDAEK